MNDYHQQLIKHIISILEKHHMGMFEASLEVKHRLNSPSYYVQVRKLNDGEIIDSQVIKNFVAQESDIYTYNWNTQESTQVWYDLFELDFKEIIENCDSEFLTYLYENQRTGFFFKILRNIDLETRYLCLSTTLDKITPENIKNYFKLMSYDRSRERQTLLFFTKLIKHPNWQSSERIDFIKKFLRLEREHRTYNQLFDDPIAELQEISNPVLLTYEINYNLMPYCTYAERLSHHTINKTLKAFITCFLSQVHKSSHPDKFKIEFIADSPHGIKRNEEDVIFHDNKKIFFGGKDIDYLRFFIISFVERFKKELSTNLYILQTAENIVFKPEDVDDILDHAQILYNKHALENCISPKNPWQEISHIKI